MITIEFYSPPVESRFTHAVMPPNPSVEPTKCSKLHFAAHLESLGVMSHSKRLQVWALSTLLSLANVWLVYRLLEGYGWAALIASVASGALVTGLLLGRLFGRRWYLAAGAGALLAVSLISVPVVLATYGFALIASPALLAYAGVVAAGAFVAGGSMPKPIPRS